MQQLDDLFWVDPRPNPGIGPLGFFLRVSLGQGNSGFLNADILAFENF